jgi:hypothetical protein
MELTPGVPLVQYFCHPCGRNFIEEDLTRKRYAIHAGMLHQERLSDETTARWLADPCPGERVVGDDADLKTRFLMSVDDRRRDERGGRQRRFTSHILPRYMRRSPKVAEVLPISYLRGLSTGDFRPALEGLLGEDAAGLSAINITRLTAYWEKEYTAFRQRDLAGREYVYVWVDGVHFNIRLEDDRLCTLVMIGARPNGEKELLAVEDGYRESAESSKALLRDLKRRVRSGPKPASRAAGVTSSATCSTSCPNGCNLSPSARCTR